MNAPIALFAYNRPGHTRKILESLSGNEGILESELFIYCDGSKNGEDNNNVDEVRSLVKSRNWAGKTNIVEREGNLGLAGSVIRGVTDLVNSHGSVIVLEDDLILSPQFLNYMNDALETYRDNPEVMHISGYLPPVKGDMPETFFFRGISSWGWATWKRAWERFEPASGKLLSRFLNRKQKKDFDFDKSIDFYNMLVDQHAGAIDSWAIRWYASVFLNGGLSLYPGWSLVNNIGHDGTGRHCHSTDIFDVQVANRKITRFEEKIGENIMAAKNIAQFYRAHKKPLHLRALGLINQKLSRD